MEGRRPNAPTSFTSSDTTMRISLPLQLPEPISSAQSLKSPSFYKPRRAYKPPPSRSARQAASYLALLLLVGLGCYFFFVVPAISWRRVGDELKVEQRPPAPHRHQHPPSPPTDAPSLLLAPPRELSRDEQLAALTSFILSPLHYNALSSFSADDVRVEDLLEFSLQSRRADEMVEEMVRDIWDEERVVVFGKRSDRSTRTLKSLLPTWNLPKPTIIELDKRDDGVVLGQLLRRLTSSTSFDDEWMLPLLIVRGTPITGGLERIKAMKESGELETLVNPPRLLEWKTPA